MKTYKPILTLSKNDRGIWDFDTTKGCKTGIKLDKKGCYSDCYSAKLAKFYGYDFGFSVDRHFINEKHRVSIVNKINKIDMPFIRIGSSGDPSENWQHMINILKKLTNENQLSLFDYRFSRQIVVITRHWNILSIAQLHQLAEFNLVINTSVSALDSAELIDNSLTQYERLKPYCKSILRVITCDFNINNIEGLRRSKMQSVLLSNPDTLETVFRPSKSNKFIKSGIINVKKQSFMGKLTLLSKNNPKTFVGKCANCIELCGLNTRHG